MTSTRPSFLVRLYTGLKFLDHSKFLEPKSLLLLVVPIAFVTSVGTAAADSEAEYLIWVIANLSALLTMFFVLGAIRFCWIRFFRDRKVHLFLGILIAAGLSAVKVWLTISAVQWLTAESLADAAVQARYYSGILGGVIAILVAALVASQLNDFRIERSLLLTAKVMQMSPALSDREAANLAKLAAGVSEVLKKVEVEERDLRLELEVIRGLVDNHVRPLSNSLYLALARDYQDFSIRQLFLSAVHNHPPAVALAIISLVGIPRSIEWYGLAIGLGISVATAIATAALVFLLGRIAEYLKLTSVVTFFAISTITPTLSYWMFVWLWSAPSVNFLVLSLTSMFWFGQTSAVFAMASVALTNAKKNNLELREISGDVDLETTRALLLRNRKRFANQMHGEVQSRMMSLVLKSEANPNMLRRAAAEELKIIASLLSATRERNAFNNELDSLVQSWKGFADVTIAPEIRKLPAEIQPQALAVIEESVSNSLRHGLASEVDLRLLGNSTLQIADNGMGPRGGRPGIGSRLLNQVCDDWSLNPGADGGSILTCNLRT